MRSRSQVRKSSTTLRTAAKDLAAILAILAPVGLASAQSTMPLIIDAGDAAPKADAAAAPASKDSAVLSDVVVSASAIPSIASEAVGGTGFAKPLLETPRAVSLINEDTLNLLGIKQVEDVVRAVPGTYTTTRYGLQGGINIRGIPADVYWRGMKRLTAQGHYRTDLSSLSNMEVVKGMAPPVFGLGRIGGYVNQTPRSGGKAQVGSYLTDITGFVQGVVGSYDKTEMSTGVGGPMNALGHQGGFYVYGLMENSGTYVEQVRARQKLLQTAMSINNFAGPFRLETGFQAQNSQTSGGYMNRVTPELLGRDHPYVRGVPMINLDAGAKGSDGVVTGAGDGYVGFRELHANSPVTGTVTAPSTGTTNSPLVQGWTWPKCTGANAGPGGWCLPGKFPTIQGIPDNFYNYLVANPDRDPTGALRAAYTTYAPQGKKGVAPRTAYTDGTTTSKTPGVLPMGFYLDPTTTGYQNVDLRRNGSFERLQNANVGLAWFDLVYDTDPDFTVKYQTFTDNLDTFKDSYLPYGEKQGLHRFEEKLTVTRRLPEKWSPSWLDVNTLGSINYRRTSGYIRSSSGDYDYRQDVMYKDPQYGDGLHYPNTKFWNQLDNPSWLTGAPPELERKSVYDEFGAGLMFDINVLKNTNVQLGARWDGSTARDTEYAHSNQANNTASSAATSCVRPASTTVTSAQIAAATTPLNALQTGRCDYGPGWDDGKTWSISVSQALPYGFRPYVTLSSAAVILDAANNIIANTIVTAPAGHIGSSRLKEAGVKGDWFNHRLYGSFSIFQQSRTDVSSPSDPTAGADSSATITKGMELQLDANPTNKFHMGFYAAGNHAKYAFNSNSNMSYTGRQIGFADVKDANGKVIYPAEAFLYGGKAFLTLPADLIPLYLDRVGEPRFQTGVNLDYKLGWGFALHADGQRFSAYYLDRTKLYRLPQSFTLNTGITWDSERVHLKVNGFNVLGEEYFRAGTGDTNVNLVSVMPGAAVQLTGKVDF